MTNLPVALPNDNFTHVVFAKSRQTRGRNLQGSIAALVTPHRENSPGEKRNRDRSPVRCTLLNGFWSVWYDGPFLPMVGDNVKSRPNTALLSFFLLSAFPIGIASAQEINVDSAVANGSEWRELFNGENLDGWQANVHPESFSVEDRVLKAHGKNGMAHLFFVGDEEEDFTFKNFELIAVTRCEPNSNSGIFFHTDRELRKGKYLNKGYEVQLNNSQREKQKTGSLYAIKPVDKSPVDETEWFELRVRVYEKRIQAFVNDKPLVDYKEPPNPERPTSRAKRLIDPNGGALAIQAHDPNSVFYFKQIRIRELGEPAKAEYFDVGKHQAFVIEPPVTSRIDGPTPWVLYAPTFIRGAGQRTLPGPEENWMIDQFHEKGIAIAGVDVGESYGSPQGRAAYQSLYEELTSKRGYKKKCVLLARSRGGLMLYNWAVEHPDSVAGVAGIYPVCNIESYPGVDKAASAYEMTAEELQGRLAEHNPIHRLAPLAKAQVPILHIHGDQDRIVPLEKNSDSLASNYRKLGGPIDVEVIKGQGHNMWEGWFQSQKLTNFIVSRALASSEVPPSDNKASPPATDTESVSGAVHGFVNQKAAAEAFFSERVTPFIKTYCIDCHQNRRPTEAGVNFSPALKHPGHAAFSHQWRKAAARVKAHDMPPEDMEQPTDEEREMFGEWLEKIKYLSPKDPGPFVIRRLTKMEYGNTLHDLFGVDRAIADGLPEEVSGEGYLNSLSPLQMEQYLSIAEKVLDQDVLQQWLGDPPASDNDGRMAAQKIAHSIARKAYRRPPSDAEIDVLLDVFDLGKQNDLEFSQAVRLMLKAVLVSPQFLFITPAEGMANDEEIVPLDDHQLASRMSYLLWATMPDEELMDLADNGKLHEPEILQAQITRLLMDSRSRALFDGFGAQWLGVGDLHEQTFDPGMFPQMTGEMRQAMYDEVRLLFENIVRENQSIAHFIDCDFTFLNERLADIYGMQETVTGAEMRKVKLSDANRGGILGMPGTLAATSFPNRTSAVNRGVWVLEQVLGDHVPSAPPDVPALDTQDEVAANLTLRERTELHRKDPVCANCHKILDPIGFGLENFDAIGRWRDVDVNGQAIDASGELPDGKSFSTPAELKSIIASRVDDFSRNLVEKLLAYALCRRLEGYDEIVVDELMQDIATDEYRMQTLIRAVVTSYPFTHRRLLEENPGRKISNEQKRD